MRAEYLEARGVPRGRIKINLTYLRALNACKEGLDAFRRAFRRGLTVKPGARLTPHTAERLATLTDYFDWLIDNIPTAWVEYDRAIAAAWDEYHRAAAAATEEYVRATVPARAVDIEYHRAYAAARAEHDRAYAAARAEHDRARMVALWRALGGSA